jgi:hypothetical protein
MSSNTAFCRDACTIEHDDRELVVRFPANVTTYAVDGSVARSTSRVGGDAIELLTSAAWAGDAIAITRTARNMRTGAEIDRSIRVSMKDDAMVIEAVSRNGQGERQVYRRRPSP